MVAYLGLSLALWLPADQRTVGEHRIKPVVVWTGTDSAKQGRGFFRCHSPQEWRKCWELHRLSEEQSDRAPCPDVDLDTMMVLAIFQGKERSSLGVQVVEILNEQETIRVRYRRLTQQTGLCTEMFKRNSVVAEARPDLSETELSELVQRHVDELVADVIQLQRLTDAAEVADYAFVVIPRSDKAIVIEEDVNRTLGEPPIWSEAARIPRIQKR